MDVAWHDGLFSANSVLLGMKLFSGISDVAGAPSKHRIKMVFN